MSAHEGSAWQAAREDILGTPSNALLAGEESIVRNGSGDPIGEGEPANRQKAADRMAKRIREAAAAQGLKIDGPIVAGSSADVMTPAGEIPKREPRARRPGMSGADARFIARTSWRTSMAFQNQVIGYGSLPPWKELIPGDKTDLCQYVRALEKPAGGIRVPKFFGHDGVSYVSRIFRSTALGLIEAVNDEAG